MKREMHPRVESGSARERVRPVGVCAALMLAGFAALAPGYAQEPSTAPVLRIEAGMHAASIRHISTDAAARLVLTVSDDKTARLWELPGGRMLRVLRPPLGEGHEGKLFAGALSPDGSLAAVGGFTNAGSLKPGNQNIYLFDTASGRIVNRIPGLPETIFELAFSGQGRFLAAGGNGWGLRVWETATGREVGRDADYGGQRSNGIDWYGEERIVTTSHDGFVRLYRMSAEGGRPQLTLLGKNSVKGGQQPNSGRFSPDGRRIAVGFYDVGAVAVFDGNDLNFLFAPDFTGIDGVLMSVTWTDGGKTIAAGGRNWKINGLNAVRRWPDGGRGKPRDMPVAVSTVMDLRPLPGGRVLYGAADPAWGSIGPRDTREVLGATSIADYRDLLGAFGVSADGATVAFAYEIDARIPARFSVARRELAMQRANAPGNDLQAPKMTGLPVTDWHHAMGPKVSGLRMDMMPYEISRSLAISRDNSSFLLGTEFNLKSVGANGVERWRAALPGQGWAVNFADEERLAVVACGDGTIRWYRADNGRELLAFFPHADRQRWVAWTPQGYFDCSPGAEDLIGWHVNRGKDQAADFFPASRFRNVFYRPDVVARVLGTRDAAEALRAANRELGLPAAKAEEFGELIARLAPPVVEIETGGVYRTVNLPAEAAAVKVRYSVRQTGSEATTKVTVRFNGRLVEVKAPPPASGGVAEVEVPLPRGMAGELSVIAEHRLAAGEADVIRIERAPGKAGPRRPNLYVLAVGVADLKMNDVADVNRDGRVTAEELNRSGVFKEGDLVLTDLVHAAGDAQKIAEAFGKQQGRLFQKVVSKVMLNQAATSAAVRDALRDVAQQAGPEDVTVFFFSGHGVIDPKAGFYLATYEADPKTPATSALTGDELSKLLEGIKARTVVALDTCHSGGAFGGTRFSKVITSPRDLTGLVNSLASAEEGTVVFSSSSASEESLEDAVKGGVFTQAMEDGLGGKAAAGKGAAVTCGGMQSWLARRIPELVAALVEGAPDAPRQTPASLIPKGVPDFPIAAPK